MQKMDLETKIFLVNSHMVVEMKRGKKLINFTVSNNLP